jgi:hypothetical protein
MIAVTRRIKATQNPPSPTVNARASTSGAPKVVSRLFFGAPASVRPTCLSIIINFLSSTSLGACADRLATFLCGNAGQRLRRALLQRTSIEIFTNVDLLRAFAFELLQSLLGERSENVVRSYAERGELDGKERDHARGLS